MPTSRNIAIDRVTTSVAAARLGSNARPHDLSGATDPEDERCLGRVAEAA